MRSCAAVLLALAAMAVNASAAPAYRPGPQVLTFISSVDGSEQPYALYLPSAFDQGRAFPLVVSLHGAYSNHRLNLRRVFGLGNRFGETDPEATRYFPPFPAVDFIVASPLARGTMGYRGIAEQDVYDMLADVERRFRVDEDRVYLTGLSMGAGGTLWLGLTRPDRWAAIAPVCPGPPPGTEELASNALNLPVHLFHGDADPVIPVETSRRWQKRLLDAGADAEYIEYPGVGHNAWDAAYKGGAIFKWFAQHKRNHFPERVRFVTSAYKYNSAYWVRIDGLTPGTPASIGARFIGPNRMEVTAAEVEGFTLELKGHPSFTAGRPLALQISGAPHRIAPGSAAVSFTRAGQSWKLGKYAPAPGAKRPGLEGPIAEAFAARHVYVYGTADAAGPVQVSARKQAAQRAADWALPNLKLLLRLPVVSDEDLTDADRASGNLILFGNKDTNRAIAAIATQLPLELNPGAADYGLIFITPVQGRYVVVNSGLPFWTGAERKYPDPPWIGVIVRTLERFPDFVLFKGSLENVVAEGRFDANWKIRSEDAERLRATGAVQIR